MRNNRKNFLEGWSTSVFKFTEVVNLIFIKVVNLSFEIFSQGIADLVKGLVKDSAVQSAPGSPIPEGYGFVWRCSMSPNRLPMFSQTSPKRTP